MRPAARNFFARRAFYFPPYFTILYCAHIFDNGAMRLAQSAVRSESNERVRAEQCGNKAKPQHGAHCGEIIKAQKEQQIATPLKAYTPPHMPKTIKFTVQITAESLIHAVMRAFALFTRL